MPFCSDCEGSWPGSALYMGIEGEALDMLAWPEGHRCAASSVAGVERGSVGGELAGLGPGSYCMDDGIRAKSWHGRGMANRERGLGLQTWGLLQRAEERKHGGSEWGGWGGWGEWTNEGRNRAGKAPAGVHLGPTVVDAFHEHDGSHQPKLPFVRLNLGLGLPFAVCCLQPVCTRHDMVDMVVMA
jgi:hypothetical protein